MCCDDDNHGDDPCTCDGPTGDGDHSNDDCGGCTGSGPTGNHHTGMHGDGTGYMQSKNIYNGFDGSGFPNQGNYRENELANALLIGAVVHNMNQNKHNSYNPNLRRTIQTNSSETKLEPRKDRIQKEEESKLEKQKDLYAKLEADLKKNDKNNTYVHTEADLKKNDKNDKNNTYVHTESYYQVPYYPLMEEEAPIIPGNFEKFIHENQEIQNMGVLIIGILIAGAAVKAIKAFGNIFQSINPKENTKNEPSM